MDGSRFRKEGGNIRLGEGESAAARVVGITEVFRTSVELLSEREGETSSPGSFVGVCSVLCV